MKSQWPCFSRPRLSYALPYAVRNIFKHNVPGFPNFLGLGYNQSKCLAYAGWPAQCSASEQQKVPLPLKAALIGSVQLKSTWMSQNPGCYLYQSQGKGAHDHSSETWVCFCITCVQHSLPKMAKWSCLKARPNPGLFIYLAMPYKCCLWLCESWCKRVLAKGQSLSYP